MNNIHPISFSNSYATQKANSVFVNSSKVNSIGDKVLKAASEWMQLSNDNKEELKKLINKTNKGDDLSCSKTTAKVSKKILPKEVKTTT